MGFFKDLFGPREPCGLCQLGRSSWPSDHNGSADWTIRGEGLRAEILICLGCRRWLMDSGMMYRHPMLVMATLVGAGVTQRPALNVYLQHPGWRAVWMQILESSGWEPSDEFAALKMMRPLEEAFMAKAGGSRSGQAPTSGATVDRLTVDAPLKAMMDEYGIPREVIQQKYVGYAVALRAAGRESNWNEDVDEHGLSLGAVTANDVERARHDLHQAILNRIKIALVMEGWWPVDAE